jgi:Fe-S cluster assembly protein SufD
MNIATISDIAEKKLDMVTGSLKDFRSTHLACLKTKGFKSPLLDSYKFTKLEPFFAALSYEPHTAEVIPEFKANFPTISFLDGEYVSSEVMPEGLKIKKIKDHFNEIKDLFKEANALSHLHHSFLNEGLIIEVSPNVEVASPIRLLNVLTKSTITASTHLVIAHPNSKVTIVEETRGLGSSHAAVNETYLFAHVGAHVEHVLILQEGAQGLNHSSVFAEVEKDATAKSFMFHMTGKLSRSNLVLNLNAPGANAESYSLFLANSHEHTDINTVTNHFAADTTSSQIAKGILDGESKGIFTGKIHIHPKAQRVASSQLNKNLLLSKKAQVHSQPQLEIFADDVKCSHGSTTGQLSDDEVFYFQARGIPADKARTLLAHGFGLEVVKKISNKSAQDHLAAIVMENLVTKFSLGGAR